MKKIILSAVTIIFATALMAGQPTRMDKMQQMSPEQKAKHIVESMKPRLSLSDDQAAKLQAIYTASLTKERDLADKIKKLRDKRDADTKGVLTTEQYEKFQQGKRKAEVHMGVRPAKAGGEKRGEKMPQN